MDDPKSIILLCIIYQHFILYLIYGIHMMYDILLAHIRCTLYCHTKTWTTSSCTCKILTALKLQVYLVCFQIDSVLATLIVFCLSFQVLILLGRAFNIYPLSFIANYFREHKITRKQQFVMWFSGKSPKIIVWCTWCRDVLDVHHIDES